MLLQRCDCLAVYNKPQVVQILHFLVFQCILGNCGKAPYSTAFLVFSYYVEALKNIRYPIWSTTFH
jgi:hypothetical protein